jgi:hypothetical protein
MIISKILKKSRLPVKMERLRRKIRRKQNFPQVNIPPALLAVDDGGDSSGMIIDLRVSKSKEYFLNRYR